MGVRERLIVNNRVIYFVLPFQEEEMPDVEIDIDDLLDAANEEERALKLQVSSM